MSADPGALVRAAAATLAAAGVPSPDHDARRLLAAAAGVEMSRLPLLTVVPPESVQRFAALVDRRAAREPLQHILGACPFRHIELLVGPGVFVPRPETEILVQAALDALARPGAATAVDLCSGSGAMALSLAVERGGTEVWAVEADPAAFDWLQRNVAALQPRLRAAGSHVHPVLADVAAIGTARDPLAALRGRVDVVASNPPYIPDAAVPRDPEVARHDPGAALFGGPDGLAVVRSVAAAARHLLRPDGLLLIEHGDLQGEAAGASGVPALLRARGDAVWADVTDHHDLAARPRFTTARLGRTGSGGAA